ncbi:sigma 54-interacting transcriptional regulator [Thermithiobacillus plumbiphilus]|uniref:Sigma 54-interacting transcriptional regulator n=1 Tax=Thermithiobacillus plumbiphilus TaxID=1729899 RepID=A0ABU9DAL4_9PROT
MSHALLSELIPLSFLQMFFTQSVKLAGQLPQEDAACHNHIQILGLTASSCLEAHVRQQLGLSGEISGDQYTALVINIKNQIGGGFAPATGEAGAIRVMNTRCPFGDRVKEAPELCRMTSSVFGGIAARNFGYAKVELRRRIANNDGCCEVLIHFDRETARDKYGDEYVSQDGAIVSRMALEDVTVRVAEKMARIWCPATGNAPEGCRGGPEIVAESLVMREALEAVELVAPTMANVLINGETGVGKEIISRAIHALSKRSEGKFVAVNCGAIPDNLIESALFGHEKGAFTGAHEMRQGVFERAAGGTLFLDEVDSLPLLSQANLLRVLQEGEFERVGGKQVLHADVRIIAASNTPMDKLLTGGGFRQDLYYRLNVVPIHIPPLRERREDITALINHLLSRLAARYQRPRKVLGSRAWGQAMAYEWPGNVRELENVLERTFLFARGQVIDELGVQLSAETGLSQIEDLRRRRQGAVRDVETKILRDALQRQAGNVSAVAREIGITPRAIHQKLRSYNIDAATYRKPGK